MLLMRYWSTGFLLLALLVGSFAYASESPANSSFHRVELFTLADLPSGKTPVEELPVLSWQPSHSKHLYLKPIDGESWVKLTLYNDHNENRLYMLQLAAHELPSVQAYFLAPDNTLLPYFNPLGLDHRFADRPIQYRYSVFPVMLDGNSSQTLFVRIDHFFALKIQPSVLPEKQFQSYTNSEMIFFGMLYGALSMIVIYSLLVYLSLRDKTYLLFLLFGTFTGIYICMLEGHFYQFIEPHAQWPKESFYALITSLMCLSFSLFSISFLDLEKRSRWSLRGLLALGSIISLFILLLGINKQPIIFSHFTLLMIGLLYLASILVAIVVWRKNQSTSAGFFALAISVCSLGFFAEFAAQLIFVPFSRLNYSYASVGNTAMILVFASALAHKMRVLQQRQLAASNELLLLTEEKANSQLESYKAQLHKSELEKKATEARIENRTKSEFITNMSADIRTPMNSILGLTELLEDTPLDAKQQHLVESINGSAKSLLNVINDLLDYSQIQTGQVNVDTRVFNLEKLIDECITIYAIQSSEAKVHFAGLVTPDTPILHRGDPAKIRQVLLNMLSNAFSFTTTDGVFLRVSSTGKTTINSNELRFEVVCHNVILNAEDKKALLTPFNSENEHRCGHELGLTVSLELAELLQGKIGIEVFEEEQCTVLWFTTRQLTPSKDELPVLTDRSKWLAGRRMLVCDGNSHFGDTVRLLSKSWGMETQAVVSNNEAIEMLLSDEQAYQVLMISEECLTPEVQIAIRQSNVAHNFTTNVILTTRTRYALSVEEMKKQGIQFILEKPYTTHRLFKALLHSMGIEMDNAKTEENTVKRLNVMIVDDNNINLMVLEGMLKKMPLDIDSAHNGLEALQLMKTNNKHYDVIFMDCEMPEMDGYKATETIREQQKKLPKNSVIIGLSAHADHEYREKAMRAGMNDFIIKPVNRDYIANLIASYRAGHFNPKEEQIVEDNDSVHP